MNNELSERRLARNPIAVVGMSGLFPMAHDHREYWQNIVDGVDCTSEVPSSRWSLEDYHDADPSTPDKTYSRRGAFLPDVEFDPVEFGLPPNQLEVTSTMQTLSLGVARDLLRDAGADGDWYDPNRTGVVLGTTGPVPLMHPLAARLSTPVLKEVVRSCGLSADDADAIAAKYVQAFAPWEENSFPGLLANVVAGRIANRLGLGGMNATVDAACAASLAAIRTAVAELVDGRADTMITGGVDTENSIFIYLCFSKVGALSPSGVIRPFDEGADGTLLGEGIGMLALRRLADAERDGNRIYAVIRGIGSSSDGRAKSIYAPRAEGQQLALDRAYADAECSPASVELFEAHATGTAVGDRTELTALGELLSGASDEPRFAALGSVKSQIGHTKGAAGTASLIKLALGLHHRVLPPTINVERANTAIGPDAPFYVNGTTRPWILDPHRPVRRAAASAMGFGGTNFHVVLEEHVPSRDRMRVQHRTARAHLWHAPDPDALLAALRAGEPSVDGVEIPEQHARIGFVAADDGSALRELAIELLAAQPDADAFSHPRGVHYRRRAQPGLKVGALFAGQGSQYLDMGAQAALNNPVVAAALDEANASFDGAGTRLAQVMYPPPVFDAGVRQGQEAALRRTEHAQPAIGALAVGQFRFLRELGLRCAAHLGHSFGELTALWAGQALSDTDFFSLARARGLAMAPESDTPDAGAMAAVTASRDEVEELLTGFPDVLLCNHNAPDQVVVGGGSGAVAEVVEACAARGFDARLLPVAAAFHTPHVAHAVEAFAAAVGSVRIGEPAAPVHANSPGACYGADPDANAATLVEQLARPVEFVAGLHAMRDAGITVFVEFGPKQVLTSLVRRTLGDDVESFATDAGPLGDSDVALKAAAVRLAVLGVPITAVNRYDAPPPAPPRTGGMAVTLSAPEYVPEQRRTAYRDALADGYRVAGSAPETAAPAVAGTNGAAGTGATGVPAVAHGSAVVATRDAGPIAPRPAVIPTATAATRPAVDVTGAALLRHVDVHAGYLEGQLRIAEQLAATVRDGAGDPAVADMVRAVVEHSAGIGHAHIRANEILASLTGLERGGPPAAPSLPAQAPPAAHPVADVDAELRALVAGPVAPPSATAPAPAAVAASVPAPPAGPDLLGVLRGVVAEKTGYPVEMVDPGMDLEADLGVDSIKRVQVLGAVQELFPELPEIGPEQLSELRTLDQIATFLGGAAPVAPAAAEPVEVAPSAAPDLLGVLRGVVAEKTGYPVEMVDPGMDLEADLGVDSIKRVQVLGAVQELFPELPEIGPEQLSELRTLDQIASFLGGAGGAGPKAPEAGATAPRHRVGLVRLPRVDLIEHPYAGEPVALMVDGGGPDGDAAAAALQASGWTVRRATGPDLGGPADLVLHLLDGPDVVDALAGAVDTAGRAVGALTTAGTRAAYMTVTRLDGELGLSGRCDPRRALLGGVGGLVKTLAAEQPAVFARAVDVDPALSPTEFAAALLAELHDAATDTLEVGIGAGGQRCTVVPGRHRPAAERSVVDPSAPPPTTTLGTDDLLVVTGGARGVTALCVRALAEHSAAGFLLLGRTALTDEPAWAAGVPDGELKPAAIDGLRAGDRRPTPRDVERLLGELRAGREIRATLAALGPRARYLAVDVTDPDAVRSALAADRDRVTGVVHGAGVLADALLPDKTPEQVRRVFAPKLDGLAAVLGALHGAPLRHLVLFTSVAGLLGNSGQADYAAANEALCRFAASHRARHPEQHVTAIDWGAWDGGMVTDALRELFSARGIPLLDPTAGARAFVEQFTAERAAETCVLIGADTSLAAPRRVPPPAFTAARDLTGLVEDPVIQAHRIGAHLVLPATFGLGWLVAVVERAHPGLAVVEVGDFQVHRGIVFDGPVPERLRVQVDAASVDGPGVRVRAAVRSGDPHGLAPSHYAATLRLAPAPAEPPRSKAHELGEGPEDALEIYRSAVQFHGPVLQGMRRILDAGPPDGDRLVLECRLDDSAVAGGAFHGRLYSPVLADVLLQGPPVLGHRLLGSPCLPLGIDRIDLYAPLPDGEPFVLVLDGVERRPTGVTVTATACTPDGAVLQRFTGVTVVSTPNLADRFHDAVRHRSEGAR